jgi:hypothetical protein
MIAFKSSGVGSGHVIPDSKVPFMEAFQPKVVANPPEDVMENFNTTNKRGTKQLPRMGNNSRSSCTMEEINGNMIKLLSQNI